MNLSKIPTDLLFNITDYLGDFASSKISKTDKLKNKEFKDEYRYKGTINIDIVPEDKIDKVTTIHNYKGENLYDYKSLTEVVMNDEFNKKILFPLPETVKKLFIGANYNKPLAHLLPNSLTSLTISHNYGIVHGIASELKLPNLLPESLTYLELNDYYNYDLDLINTNIKTLIIGPPGSNSSGTSAFIGMTGNQGTFNKSLNKLPNTLIDLKIRSHRFNQSLSNLPNTITSITLYSNEFNQELSKLPRLLTKLEIWCNSFNQYINNLPTDLEYLFLQSRTFNHSINIRHLQKLTYLKLECNNFNKLLDYLPLSLTKLELISTHFNQPVNKLPQSLTELYIGVGLDENEYNIIDNNFSQSLDYLPQSLTKLTLVGSINESVSKLPINLQSLDIYCDPFNQSLDNLPSTLTLLDLNIDNINTTLNKLPLNLSKLSINCRRMFNQSLENLPSNLNKLTLTGNNIQGLSSFLPDNLQILEVVNAPGYKLSKLPLSLITLTMTLRNIYPLYEIKYPLSLKKLHISYLRDQISDLENIDSSFYKLPPGLISLHTSKYLYRMINNLPESLQSLHILDTKSNINLYTLPKTLTDLNITCSQLSYNSYVEQLFKYIHININNY